MQPKLTRISAAEAVVNHFKELIETAALKPGDKLPSERQLQQSLNISRFSLREGLARLSALGIVHIIHGKGAYVSKEISRASLANVFVPLFSANELNTYRDLGEARLVIERESALRAANRRNNADIEKLKAIVAEMRASQNTPEKFGELDHRFHRIIVATARNVFFERMFDVIGLHLKQFLYHHAQSPNARTRALRQHAQIVNDIAAREGRAAAKHIETHLCGCRKNFEQAIKPSPERKR